MSFRVRRFTSELTCLDEAFIPIICVLVNTYYLLTTTSSGAFHQIVQVLLLLRKRLLFTSWFLSPHGSLCCSQTCCWSPSKSFNGTAETHCHVKLSSLRIKWSSAVVRFYWPPLMTHTCTHTPPSPDPSSGNNSENNLTLIGSSRQACSCIKRLLPLMLKNNFLAFGVKKGMRLEADGISRKIFSFDLIHPKKRHLLNIPSNQVWVEMFATLSCFLFIFLRYVPSN